LPLNKKIPIKYFYVIRTKLPLAFTGLLFFSFLSWNCTKIDTTTLGGNLIPAIDNVNTFDTLINVVANNIDSVPLGKACAIVYPTDDHALGYIGNDPYFGTTKATIYAELKPAFPFSFEGKPAERTLDSVVLILSYRKAYGDSTSPQGVRVHEISGTFTPDSNTCSSYPFNAVALGSATYIPQRLKDSIKAFRDTTTNQLRINLTSSSLGARLLAQDSIKTDSAFREVLKGFAIVPDNMGNALSYFSLIDSRTKLAVYYKYKKVNPADTTVVTYLRFTTASKDANNIVRDRSGAEMNGFTNTGNPAGDNFIYIQTEPGSFAELKIPGLTGLSNRIVHRAELIIDQVYSPLPVNQFLSPPNFLFLDLQDSAKGPFHGLPCDFSVIQGQPDIVTYGGYKTTVSDPSGTIARYTFNISRYIQRTITRQRPLPTLRLSAPNYIRNLKNYVDECNLGVSIFIFPINNIAEGRVKLFGGNATGTSANRMRLRIIYSRL